MIPISFFSSRESERRELKQKKKRGPKRQSQREGEGDVTRAGKGRVATPSFRRD
ncbi:uncharacterized protein G2W53_033126 [Senna tora]|uniref:Uncharacterized protein n=1 Tax=Senna tora TaxID=362788 RepID=A0A834W6T3_9FABA|nr:uncharacterized protein G2W53_033126 [Senna tora]